MTEITPFDRIATEPESREDYAAWLDALGGVPDLQPGEYVAARLAKSDTEGAEMTAHFQYAEGFRAAMRDEPYANFRPANWGRGWCDAYALQEFGPMFAAREL